jgi:hypothetical protein
VLVIAGILIAIFWSLLIGIIVALVGLVAFGGFVRGRWYYARPNCPASERVKQSRVGFMGET